MDILNKRQSDFTTDDVIDSKDMMLMDVEITDPEVAEDFKAMSMAKIASTNRILRDSILH